MFSTQSVTWCGNHFSWKQLPVVAKNQVDEGQIRET